MKRFLGVMLAMVIGLTAVGCGKKEAVSNEDYPNVLQAQLPTAGEEIAVITTSLGEIKLRLYPKEAPKAVENFVTHAKDGYYDGFIYHRVINDFMIQTGDPTGTGTGGESIWGEAFEDELSPNLHFYRGALAMANAGPNTNGSQFFIVQSPKVSPDVLNVIRQTKTESEEVGLTIGEKFYSLEEIFPEDVLAYYEAFGGTAQLESVFGAPYTIFGQAFEGLDVVDQIAAVETDGADKPLEDVVIEKIEIVKYEPTA